MRHDPHRATAAYLAGELTQRARARFDRHLLDCEHCWREANTARAGRTLAESLRDTAPAALRERIRAVADLAPADPAPAGSARQLPRSRRWPYLLVGSAAAVLLAVLTIALTVLVPSDRQDQPAPLTAAARLYHAAAPSPSVAGPGLVSAPPKRQVANYHWQVSTVTELSGITATVHTYSDADGRRLLIISSSTPFPRAREAREITPAPSWITDIDGVTLLCADQHDVSWLAVAATSHDALAAGRDLGLTTE